MGGFSPLPGSSKPESGDQKKGHRSEAIEAIEAMEGSSGAFTGENLPFVTEPRETNAVAFPRWVEEPPHPLLG